MKPRIKVKAYSRMLGQGVPDDAQPGDLVVGNRGAAARVVVERRCLVLEYIGNIYIDLSIGYPGTKIYDFSGGTRP